MCLAGTPEPVAAEVLAGTTPNTTTVAKPTIEGAHTV